MNKTLASAKNFIERNERRVLITTVVLTTTAAVVMRSGVVQHNEFLKEHNLFDTFYNAID